MTRNEIALACMGAAATAAVGSHRMLEWVHGNLTPRPIEDCADVVVQIAFEMADAFMAEIDGEPNPYVGVSVTS